MEYKIRSMETLLKKIATRKDTAFQEPEHDRYIEEVARNTEEVLDIDERHKNDIREPQLCVLRARLTKIRHWVDGSENAVHTRDMRTLTILRNKESTTSLAEIKVSLQDKLRGTQTLL